MSMDTWRKYKFLLIKLLLKHLLSNNKFIFQTKIKDRYWVLDECLLRIPDDFDATEQLLKYGLLGTSWKVVQAIDGLCKDDDISFVLDDNSVEDLEEDDNEKILSIK